MNGRHGRIVYSESRQPLEALPFDTDAARAYGRVFAAITGGGRKARGKPADASVTRRPCIDAGRLAAPSSMVRDPSVL